MKSKQNLKLIIKYNITDNALNMYRTRIEYIGYLGLQKGKARFKSFDVLHRTNMLRRLREIKEPAVIYILSPFGAETKFQQELKRGYYDSEKAKKYFP